MFTEQKKADRNASVVRTVSNVAVTVAVAVAVVLTKHQNNPQ